MKESVLREEFCWSFHISQSVFNKAEEEFSSRTLLKTELHEHLIHIYVLYYSAKSLKIYQHDFFCLDHFSNKTS